MKKYTSWSMEIELTNLNEGFLLTAESIKGLKEYTLKDKEEIINTIIMVCKNHKFDLKKVFEILESLNIKYNRLKIIQTYKNNGGIKNGKIKD